MTPAADILIVDDKADNLRLLSSILADENYTVRKAISGTMALTAVSTVKPDLILLDITMPGMNGYEVCRFLKEDPNTAAIPVIFLSALDETLDKVKAFQVGGVDYITKPFQVEEVLIRISTHLTLHHQRQKLLEQQAALELEIQERKLAELELQWQRRRADDLLYSILPRRIAEVLKHEEKTIACSFESVTVMFADLVNFTPLAAQIDPIQLVSLLNQIFSSFDTLVETHGVEKIKTIGDAYMVVAGVPTPRQDHAQVMAHLALDMQQAITQFSSPQGDPLQLRIGLHSGPVVAGVIGRKKFSYDLWGDTVNVASRLEAQGKQGRIQMSEVTYDLIKDTFTCQHRGTITLKGRGQMETYWLEQCAQDS